MNVIEVAGVVMSCAAIAISGAAIHYARITKRENERAARFRAEADRHRADRIRAERRRAWRDTWKGEWT